MLTPLAAAETSEDMAVVMRLLKEGDVNVRAAQVRGVQGVCRARVVGKNVPKPKPAELLLVCLRPQWPNSCCSHSRPGWKESQEVWPEEAALGDVC